MKGKTSGSDVLCAALAAVFVLLVVVPFQSWLSNAAAFGFGVGTLARTYLPRALVAAATLALVLPLSRRFGTWVAGGLLGLALAGLGEATWLSAGLPEMNGDFSGYGSAFRASWDALALAVLLAAPVAVAWRFGGSVKWMSAAIAFYAAAAMLDVRRSEEKAPSAEEPAGCVAAHVHPRGEVLDSVAYSREGNVFVLIPDATSSDVVSDILGLEPALRKSFSGFVNYTNNVGMHWPTAMAIPATLTGRLCASAGEIHDYANAAFGADSAAVPWLEAGRPVFANFGPGRHGVCNRVRGHRSGGEELSAANARMDSFFPMTVGEFSLFRTLPYALKGLYLRRLSAPGASRTVGGSRDVFANEVVLSSLAKAETDDRFGRTLQIHHFKGLHLPVLRSADGRPVDCPNPCYGDYRDQGRYVFRQIAGFLDALRRKGLYDGATIFVAGDHGIDLARDGFRPSDVPHYAFPCLMVKAPGARGPCADSALPTSHAGIAPLLRTLCDGDLSGDRIGKALSDAPRLCRKVYDDRLEDWSFADQLTDVTRRVTELGQRDAACLRVLEPGRAYNFSAAKARGNYPDFALANGTRDNVGGLGTVDGLPLELSVRLPVARRTYDVILEIEFKKGTEWTLVGGENARRTTVHVPRRKVSKLRLEGAESDSAGVLKLSLAAPGGKATVRKIRMEEVCR